MDHASLADQLWQAQRDRTPCAPLTATEPDLSVADAYAIQAHNLRRRKGGEGHHGRAARSIGHKIGLTSDAIQEWLGVDEPDFGELLDDMVVADGGVVDSEQLLQPKAEAELAFVLGAELAGPGVTVADVIRATDFVVPAIEIIDSRVADWDITIADTVADNASSALFVLGSRPVRLGSFDTRTCGMALRKNGRVVSTGAGAACLGDPLQAVVWLANKLGEFDRTLQAGEVVLSGALGPVTEVVPGDFLTADIAHVGSVSVRFG